MLSRFIPACVRPWELLDWIAFVLPDLNLS